MPTFPIPLIQIYEFCVEFLDGSFNEYPAHVIAEKLCYPVRRWPIYAPSTRWDGDAQLTDAAEPLIFASFR